MPADEEEVARLDVEVLQAVLLIEQVEDLGRLLEVAQQFGPRHAGPAGGLALHEQVVQAAVGQLHHDDQLAADPLDAVHAEQKRVAEGLDVLQGAQLLLGAVGAVRVNVVVGAADELDGLEKSARRLALPDLAEAAGAERLDEPVARDRFGVGRLCRVHRRRSDRNRSRDRFGDPVRPECF